MARVTVHHLTLPKHLPMIEEDGLRTRADLSEYLGTPDGIDTAAPGRFAHGKRVSFWASGTFAREQVATFGGGYVTTTVDPAKTLANRAQAREAGDAEAYWAGTKPFAAWLADGDLPDDLEVHQNLPVRVKHLHLMSPLVGAEELGDFAPLVDAVADEDRLSAKALMHLAILACDGDFDDVAFTAACALAWRDEPDPANLIRELVDLDPDKVASAALAEHGTAAPQATARLREVLDETRTWSEQNGMEPGQGMFSRTAVVLDELPIHLRAGRDDA
ncbi:MAG: hypothetical protein JJT89_11115 [Nitriliruptoraceae bacterium]|nr:hypothetical protein [Nitriliruptoraceae bacterium]